MELLQKVIAQAMESFSMTYDDIEYNLTPDEEETAWSQACVFVANVEAQKLRANNFPESHIEKKIANLNYEELLNREDELRQYNFKKHYATWQIEMQERESRYSIEKQKELAKYWTCGRMLGYMRLKSEQSGRKLIENADTMPLIRALCLFASRDKRFESNFFSLQKGLWLRGDSGRGKTHLVKCISRNRLNPINILSMIEITDDVKENGFYDVKAAGHILYLDDVGSEEPTVMHYGTKISWFKDFIEKYYLRGQPFQNLIISTNNSFDEIEKKYGARIRSRIKDMFNIVNVTGKDLRGT